MSNTYYRIIQSPDVNNGLPYVIAIQGFDEYDRSRLLTALRFDTENEAHLWLSKMRELCRRLGGCKE